MARKPKRVTNQKHIRIQKFKVLEQLQQIATIRKTSENEVINEALEIGLNFIMAKENKATNKKVNEMYEAIGEIKESFDSKKLVSSDDHIRLKNLNNLNLHITIANYNMMKKSVRN